MNDQRYRSDQTRPRFLLQPTVRLRPITAAWCVLLSISWIAPCEPSFGDQPLLDAGFDVIENAEGVLIREADQSVLFYQRRPKSLEGRFERANYVHPLFDLDGIELTEDFPEDHRHHRGVFWTWHQVWIGDQRIGDPWVIKDFAWDVTQVRVSRGSQRSIVVRAIVDWKSPRWIDTQGNPQPLVRETVMIRVHRSTEKSRKIDFQIALLALTPDVQLGGSEDDKGYGGFSVRVRLPDDVVFTSKEGAVQPQRSAIQAGPWIDVSATYGGSGERSGVTILSHPSMPGFPHPWILRQRRSMQNPAYPGREAISLSSDQPLLLAYRLVIHRGQPHRDEVEKWQAEFAGVDLRDAAR